jgi:hypothetical protein
VRPRRHPATRSIRVALPRRPAVEVGDDEDARRSVADALRAAGPEFLNYYGEKYIEALGQR